MNMDLINGHYVLWKLKVVVVSNVERDGLTIWILKFVREVGLTKKINSFLTYIKNMGHHGVKLPNTFLLELRIQLKIASILLWENWPLIERKQMLILKILRRSHSKKIVIFINFWILLLLPSVSQLILKLKFISLVEEEEVLKAATKILVFL